MHIIVQSIDVDAPPDIIDVDEDDDIIDEEDPIPHDLADSDDEDLINLDIEETCQRMLHGVMAVTVAVMIVPLHTTYPPVVGVAWATEVMATRKPIWVAGEWAALPPHAYAARRPRTSGAWQLIGAQLPGELDGSFLSLTLPGVKCRRSRRRGSWLGLGSIAVNVFYAADSTTLQKIYNGKKAALKERYWIPDSDGTYDLERIRLSRPSHISEVNWDAQIAFWNDPKNRARATQNKQNRAKSKVMESSATREYPSLIHTFFLTHTVNGVFLNLEDKALYGLGSNTETGVPYTEDDIMAIVRGGKQRGHIPGVGRVLPRQARSFHLRLHARTPLMSSDDKFSQMLTQLESQPEIGGGSGSGGRGDDEQGDDEDDSEDGEIRTKVRILLGLLRKQGLTIESKGDEVIFFEGRKLPLVDLAALCTWLDYVGPLITDELDSEKRWSYRDPKGNIQGSFSLAQLHMWKDYFPSDLQIWSYYGNVKETILLHNALKRRTKNAGQRDKIEICITAAKSAGLIVTNNADDPLSHVGFGLVQGKAEDKDLEHTAEALGYGAVKYADLKNNSYTFSFNDMLNEKGNTAAYLQYTYARICKIMRTSWKHIDELEVETLSLKDGGERELGLHLLRFTEVLAKACRVLAPHIMCEYLYVLCKKFDKLYSSDWQVVHLEGNSLSDYSLSGLETLKVIDTYQCE
ncbi:RNA-directed DNA polymerase, eukaryota [Tanacetum coccineum]